MDFSTRTKFFQIIWHILRRKGPYQFFVKKYISQVMNFCKIYEPLKVYNFSSERLVDTSQKWLLWEGKSGLYAKVKVVYIRSEKWLLCEGKSGFYTKPKVAAIGKSHGCNFCP